jgi:aspartate carbamoyltransferase regulatory subunit
MLFQTLVLTCCKFSQQEEYDSQIDNEVIEKDEEAENENIEQVFFIKNARCATRIYNKVSETFSDRKFI